MNRVLTQSSFGFTLSQEFDFYFLGLPLGPYELITYDFDPILPHLESDHEQP